MKYKANTKGSFLGEEKKGTEIGYKSLCYWVWHACEICGFERWAVKKGKGVVNKWCQFCSPNNTKHNNGHWKGGRIKSGNYISIWVSPETPFYLMANKKHYIAEHRLIIAKSLGRCLEPWEIVHHINGIKTDNRIENLQLLPEAKYHTVDSVLKAKITTLGKRVIALEQENTMLKEKLLCLQV